MLSPSGTGTARGQLRGVGGAGKPEPNAGVLAPAGGAQRRESQATGRPDAARPGKVPCISYMEGTLSYSARHKRLGQDRHAGRHPHAIRGHSWIPRRKNRAETDPAELPAEQDALARQRLEAPAEE